MRTRLARNTKLNAANLNMDVDSSMGMGVGVEKAKEGKEGRKERT